MGSTASGAKNGTEGDEPAWKKQRIERVQHALDSNQLKILESFFDAYWPMADDPLQQVGEDLGQYNQRIAFTREAYQDWKLYNLDMFFGVKTFLNPPYFKDNVPPQGARLQTMDQNLIRSQGTLVLIQYFMSGDLGPTRRTHPIDPKNIKSWCQKWFASDFWKWMHQKDIWEVLPNATAANVFTPPPKANQDTTPDANEWWGVGKKNPFPYPSHWTAPALNNGPYGVTKDWPEPNRLVASNAYPNLNDSWNMACPSLEVRQFWKACRDSNHIEELPLWPAGYNYWMENMTAEVKFLGLSGDIQLIDYPKPWLRAVIYFSSRNYAKRHVENLFLPYKEMFDGSDSNTPRDEVEVKEWLEKHPITKLSLPPTIRLNTQDVISISNIAPLLEARYHDVDSSLVYLSLNVRRLASHAFDPFAVDYRPFLSITIEHVEIRWEHIDHLLDHYKVTPWSSSRDVIYILLLIVNAFVEEMAGKGIETPEEVRKKLEGMDVKKPDPQDSALKNYVPSYGDPSGLLLNDKYLIELRDLWVKGADSAVKAKVHTNEWSIPRNTPNPIYKFIWANMILPLKNKGLWAEFEGQVASLFGQMTERKYMIDIQWRAYLLWVETNVMTPEGKIVPIENQLTVGKKLKVDGKHVRDKNNQPLLNLQPDIGILEHQGEEINSLWRYMPNIVGVLTALFGSDFVDFMKGVFSEVFQAVLNAIRWVWNHLVKPILDATWPFLLLGGALLIGGAVGTKYIEKRVV